MPVIIPFGSLTEACAFILDILDDLNNELYGFITIAEVYNHKLVQYPVTDEDYKYGWKKGLTRSDFLIKNEGPDWFVHMPPTVENPRRSGGDKA